MSLHTIESFVYKNLRFYFTKGGSIISKNEKAFYIESNDRRTDIEIHNMVKRLPEGTGYFHSPKGRHIFAPIETPEQKIAFAEIKASEAGSRLLDHQQETIELMAAFKEALIELKELKKNS